MIVKSDSKTLIIQNHKNESLFIKIGDGIPYILIIGIVLTYSSSHIFTLTENFKQNIIAIIVTSLVTISITAFLVYFYFKTLIIQEIVIIDLEKNSFKCFKDFYLFKNYKTAVQGENFKKIDWSRFKVRSSSDLEKNMEILDGDFGTSLKKGFLILESESKKHITTIQIDGNEFSSIKKELRPILH